MLQSILDNSIEYILEKTVEKKDIDVENPVYHLKLFNVDVALTIGNVNREYANIGVLYCPVYVIVSKTKFEKIGYFEFYSSETAVLLDKDGDFNLELMEGPLLFEYVDFDYLNDLVLKSKFLREFIIEDEKYVKNTASKTDDEIIKQADKINVEEKKTQVISNLESIENIEKILNKHEAIYNSKINKRTLEIYKKEAKSSIITENSNWLQKYYNNNNYNILDNEGGGDCFFATIRDALEEVKITINVESIRAILASIINQSHYDNYSTIYNSLKSEILELREKVNKIKVEFSGNINKISVFSEAAKKESKSGSRNIELLQSQMSQIKNIKKINGDLKQEDKKVKTELKAALSNMQEFKFMRNINNLEDFKNAVRSRNYWADSFAISILEYALNIKTIIVSKENHIKKNVNSLISCSDMVLNEIERNNDFKPKYYIIVIHEIDTNHYKLLTYKSKKIFTYYEIPYPIKENIVDNCIKNSNGLYNRLTNFAALKNDMNTILQTRDLVSKANELLEKNELEMYRKVRSEIDEIFSSMTEIRKSYIPTLLEASKKSDN